jgi:hypothetical protein
VHRAREANPALKACREQREKKVIPVLRVLTVHRVKEANRVLKARREPKEKKAIPVLKVLGVRRAKGANPALKGSRDPQGQSEILQTPAACKTLKTALPNWKGDWRSPGSVVSHILVE